MSRKGGKSRAAHKYDFIAIPKNMSARIESFIANHPEQHFESRSHFAKTAIEELLKKLGEKPASADTTE